MRTFEEKKQCEAWQGRKLDMCCVQHDLECKADSCVSRRYHKSHPQLDWHNARQRLADLGLEDEYEKDMEE